MSNRTKHSARKESILLPSAVNAGVIIGKGGSNIKKIESLTGAKLFVTKNGSGDVVEISGSPLSVKQAYEMVQQQISVFLSSGGGYPHPLENHYLLSPEFNDQGMVSFSPSNDEVAQGAERREQLYVIQPHPGHDDDAGAHDEMNCAVAHLSLDQARTPSRVFHGATERDDVLSMLRDSMVLAASHQPKFSELKLRFNFGKSLFYNGVQATPVTFKTLQGKRVGNGADFKSVYSNVVTEAKAAALKHTLLGMAAFKLVEEKHSAFIHLQHEITGAGYNVSLTRTDGGGLSVRRIKSATNKLFFLCSNNPPDMPDFRLKLVALYHLQDACERRLVEEACCDCQLQASGGLSAPHLAAARLTVIHARAKDKEIYEGTLKVTDYVLPHSVQDELHQLDIAQDAAGMPFTVKVTFIKVTLADGRTHNEVTGCCTELNACLETILQTGSSADRELADGALMLVHALLEFAWAVRA